MDYSHNHGPWTKSGLGTPKYSNLQGKDNRWLTDMHPQWLLTKLPLLYRIKSLVDDTVSNQLFKIN